MQGAGFDEALWQMLLFICPPAAIASHILQRLFTLLAEGWLQRGYSLIEMVMMSKFPGILTLLALPFV
jgi:hypothetical protein